MIVGLGVDLVDAAKLGRMLASERFRRRVYSAQELAEAQERRDPAALLAGKFAAKEAFLKALGIGVGRGVRLVEIEVVKGPEGVPRLALGAAAAARMAQVGADRALVSLSHSGGFVVAVVVLEAGA